MSPICNRRHFLQQLASTGAVAAFAPALGHAQTPQSTPRIPPALKDQIGFQLFTVTGPFMRDPEGTLAALYAMGIREVQPRTYIGQTPAQFRALLDRHKMTCHSTHEFSIPGPGLEKDLEGLQVMGIKYARFPLPGQPLPGSGRGRGAGAGGNAAEGREGGGGGRGGDTMVETPEFMKRVAADLNKNGQAAKKFGIKALYHNHTTEFQRYPGQDLPYDVLIKETDPELVALEIDLGWSSVAGQDATAMFKAHPGRYELWHIKDAIGIKHLTPQMNQLERRAAITLMPVGLGEIDWKTIFSHAELAGLKHFYIEQDNAGAWGDAMAATRVSVDNLKKILA